MQVESLGGARYYLVAVAEATRYSWLQPIRTQDGAGKVLVDIIGAMSAATGGNHRVLHLRSDKGGEFLNEELGAKLKELGVVHEPTTAYSPESNGLAERTNRTIMEKVRSILCFGLQQLFMPTCCAT